MTSDERLRELYARALDDGATAATAGAHADPDAILALVRREGTEARRLELLEHVMSCASCRRSFELLRSIEAAGAAERAHGTRRRFLRTYLPLALAASVTLVLGIPIAQRLGVRSQPEVTRGASETVVLLAPGPVVAPNEPLTFAWRPVPGALRYELELLDGNDAIVFSATTTDTLLAASGVRLVPRADYRWWIRAVTAGGHVASPARPLRSRE